MTDNVLAIDAGTTNVLAMILDADGRVLSRALTKYELHYPAPGLVEQDPEELWSTTAGTVSEALKKAGLAASDLGAVGITGQRSTIIIWERESGKTLGPAISWQDQRGTQRASELAAQGFPVNQTTAASKLESVIDNLTDGRERVGKGELAFGNVDSFIAWRLSGGRVHATDCSQACTTGYYDFFAQTRNDKLIELQGLDPSLFPDIVDTSSIIGATSARSFGAEVPIGAIVGDQQSAVYGQGCLKPGEGKVTFGTALTTAESALVTVDARHLTASYLPITRNWSLDMTADMLDTTTFSTTTGSVQWRTFADGLSGATVELGRINEGGSTAVPAFFDRLNTNQDVIVELIHQPAGTTFKFEAYARMSGDGFATPIDALVEESASLTIDGPLYFATTE